MRNAYKMLEYLKGRNHLEYPGVDGRIILGGVLDRVGRYGMDFLAEDRIQGQVFMNMVMNLQVS